MANANLDLNIPNAANTVLDRHRFQEKAVDRSYEIKEISLYAHVLFFENEVHRSLESVVAEHGIFIHFNSFYLAPIQQLGQTIGSYANINVMFKSINSVHFVYLYGGYENQSHQRKLNFASHNLKSLQLRNGTDLYPSEPIRGQSGTSFGAQDGTYHQFMVEMYKSWNKLHDPTTDSAITPPSFMIDLPC